MQQLIETMTLNETVRRLRLLGVSTTETKVANAIQAGLYPWGSASPAASICATRSTPSCLKSGWMSEPPRL